MTYVLYNMYTLYVKKEVIEPNSKIITYCFYEIIHCMYFFILSLSEPIREHIMQEKGFYN